MALHRSVTFVCHNLTRSGRNRLLSPYAVAPGSLGIANVRWNSDIAINGLNVSPEVPGTAVTIFSDLPPVLALQDALCQMHDSTGLMWGPTIVIATVGVRLLVGMPISIMQQKAVYKLEQLQPLVKDLVEDIRRETSIAKKIYNWSDKRAIAVFKQAFKKHHRNLVEEYNCHPLRSVALALLQIPAWVTLSSAIRNIAYKLPEGLPGDQELRFAQLVGESPLWIESLATPDPFLLPAIFVGATLVNIGVHRANAITVPQSTTKKAIPIILGGFAVGVGFLATYVPSAVSLYWAASACSALALNLFLRAPGVKSTLGIGPKSTFSLGKKASGTPATGKNALLKFLPNKRERQATS